MDAIPTPGESEKTTAETGTPAEIKTVVAPRKGHPAACRCLACRKDALAR